MSKYIYNVKKKTCLGVLDRRERDKNNETDLKEGGVIEMSTTVLPFAMHAPSLEYLPEVEEEDEEPSDEISMASKDTCKQSVHG